jgi:hypothetical protein
VRERHAPSGSKATYRHSAVRLNSRRVYRLQNLAQGFRPILEEVNSLDVMKLVILDVDCLQANWNQENLPGRKLFQEVESSLKLFLNEASLIHGCVREQRDKVRARLKRFSNSMLPVLTWQKLLEIKPCFHAVRAQVVRQLDRSLLILSRIAYEGSRQASYLGRSLLDSGIATG